MIKAKQHRKIVATTGALSAVILACSFAQAATTTENISNTNHESREDASLRAQPVDHGVVEADLAELSTSSEMLDAESLASTPSLYLAPRVSSTLEAVFDDDSLNIADVVPSQVLPMPESEATAVTADNDAETSDEDKQKRSKIKEITQIQQEMYRSDIR